MNEEMNEDRSFAEAMLDKLEEDGRADSIYRDQLHKLHAPQWIAGRGKYSGEWTYIGLTHVRTLCVVRDSDTGGGPTIRIQWADSELEEDLFEDVDMQPLSFYQDQATTLCMRLEKLQSGEPYDDD